MVFRFEAIVELYDINGSPYFSVSQQALLIVAVVCGLQLLAGVTSAASTYKARAKLDPYRDFVGDKDLELDDEPDDKPPNRFAGNVMQAAITNAETRTYGKGKFKNSFETQNGIQVSQVGKLRDDKVFVVMGSYSYTGADGRRYRVKYTADEFGYHPITELDLDLPELELKPATVRPTVKSSASTFGKGGAKSNGVGKTGANNGDSQHNSKNNQFTYGKATPPPSSASAHTYLPPNGYLPPATYLPPIGVKPTRRP